MLWKLWYKTNQTKTIFHILRVSELIGASISLSIAHLHPHPSPIPPIFSPPPPGRWLLQAVREVGYKTERDGALRRLLVLRKDTRYRRLSAVFGKPLPD